MKIFNLFVLVLPHIWFNVYFGNRSKVYLLHIYIYIFSFQVISWITIQNLLYIFKDYLRNQFFTLKLKLYNPPPPTNSTANLILHYTCPLSICRHQTQTDRPMDTGSVFSSVYTIAVKSLWLYTQKTNIFSLGER